MITNTLKFPMLILLLCSWQITWAQERYYTGRVFDITGEPLIGATVVVPGSEDIGLIGTIADMDGFFEVNVPPGLDSLTISFTGYESQTLLLGQKKFLEVFLSPSVDQLQEVVVTALGIRREQKALGYSVQEIGGEEMENSSGITPMEALSGRVSGLNIGSSGNGPGSTTKVLIRGVNSLTGNNEPLYVVDGIPIDNSGGSSGSMWGGYDYGNAVNNINPEDIESVSVLKGGAAAALYGARGQNGVIMITTKKGNVKKGLGVNYKTSVQFETPMIIPELQTDYSQGSSGEFEPYSYRSWGVKLDKQDPAGYTNFLNQNQGLSIDKSHPYELFFQNGLSLKNTVSISKRGEQNGIYFSASLLKNDGIIPDNVYKKNSLTVRYDSKIAKYLKLDAKVNYIYQDANNRPNLSGSPDNPVHLLTVMPRSVQLNHLKKYKTVDGYPVVWTSSYNVNDDGTVSWLNSPPPFASSPLLQNPYWAINENTNHDMRHRLIGFGELNLDMQQLFSLDFELSLIARAGMDFYNESRERITAHNTYYKADGLATMSTSKYNVWEQNYDALLVAGHTFGSIRTKGTIGANLMHRTYNSIASSSESGLINEVGPYVIQNFLNPISSNGLAEREIQSIYGLFSADYKSLVFLDLTFRNDWTSSLSPENWSYFYPSVGMSFILSDLFKMPFFINFMKLRGSWAGVGNGGSYESMRFIQYGTNPNQYYGLPYGTIPSVRPLYDLRSEFTISKEVGLNVYLFEDRIKLDATFYETGTRDQIFQAPLSPSSGYNYGLINAGYIKNTGLEVALDVKSIHASSLTLSHRLNFTRQWSLVEELADEIDILTIGGAAGIAIAAKPDYPVGIMLGSTFDRDEDGRLLLDGESLPVVKTTEEGSIDYEQIIGNSYPDYLLGFSTSLQWKNLFFSFHLDSKLGHEIFSLTNQRGAEYGTLQFTVEGRDEWENAKEIAIITQTPPNDGFIVKGVKDGVEGEYPVDPQKYWDRLSRINEAFVYDASYIRLRQLSLGYNFNFSSPKNPFKNMKVSFVMNNLAYLMRNTENISPESSFGTGNATGIEMFAFPELRSYAFNLEFDF